MKALLFGFLIFAAGSSQASDIRNCVSDAYGTGRINEVPVSERIDVRNKLGEVVGALVFNDATKTSFAALYLCGSNPGYFYAEGKPADWVTTPGQTVDVGFLYNDEYEVVSSAKTLSVGEFYSRVELNLTVKWTGEDESDADYPNFSDTVVVTLPLTKF